MIKSTKALFGELLKTTEVRKTDFKQDQYELKTVYQKSKFVKDILCMANASGDDGYILLGVKAEKGKPRKITGITQHHDSSDLEAIVNGVIEPPIQLEYYPVVNKSKECALLHIPISIAKPHWPKKDYGSMAEHVFYTRRASGNRKASIQEIGQMFMETMRLSDAVARKVKTSIHVFDELATYSMDERESRMYEMLKSVIRGIGFKYHTVVHSFLSQQKEIVCLLISNPGNRDKHEYAVLMYPWTVKGNNIFWSRSKLQGNYGGSNKNEQQRMEKSTLIHVAYKTIHTSSLERRLYSPGSYWFANELKEDWGKVIQWEDRQKIVKYEFFVPNVTSRQELRERLEKLFTWADKNVH